jgi:glutamate/tyrosine decarboxylase-like PLP-dependent enzyme
MKLPDSASIQAITQTLTAQLEKVFMTQEPRTVGQLVSAATVRQHLHRYNFQEPLALEGILADVSHMLQEWNIQMTHPRYLGLFNPATTLASIVADTLVALYNPQLAAWSHAPAANEIERHTLHFIGQKIGFRPETMAANFTSGGSEANLTAMLAALAWKFPAYLADGLVGLGAKPVCYVSEYAHNSFDKICKNVGIGLNALRIVPTNELMQFDANLLAKQIEQDKQDGLAPFMVIGTAGTTSAGIIDPLAKLATVSRQFGLWFHVDGAWAGALVLSEKHKPLLQGIEQADSVTIDAHKWLSVPFGAGMFFCSHQDVIRQVFSVRADYMPKANPGTTDPYTSTLHWTRRFIGLKLFMTLAEMGEENLSDLLDEQMALGQYLKEKLIVTGWKVVNQTPLPVVCFTHPKLENGSVTIEQVLEKIYNKGDMWISSVPVQSGQKAFRACITNYRTTQQDLDWVVDELGRLINE